MTDLIQNLTALDWAEAKRYFINNPKAVKFDKYKKDQKLIQDKDKRIKGVNCSFIKVEGTIYAIKNGKSIGEGSFGKVKVLQNEAGENFAVKIEGRGKRSDQDAELKIMSVLNKFHGQGERKNYNKYFKNRYSSEKLYTIMDLEEGKELFGTLFLGKSRGGYRKITNEQKKLIIAINSCKAIKYLHDRRIIHRDIKSENFMINNAMNVTAIDFGLSSILPNNKNVIQDEPLGTPGFCAPEILERREGKMFPKIPALYSFASDIYALGIMFKYDLGLQMGNLFYKQITHLDPKQRFLMTELLDRLYEKLEMQPNLNDISKKMIDDYKEKNLNIRIKFKEDIQSAKTIDELSKIISSYSGELLDDTGRRLNKKAVAQNIHLITNNKKMIGKIIKNNGFLIDDAIKFGITQNHGIEKKLVSLIFRHNNELIFIEKIRKSSSIPKLVEVVKQYPIEMYDTGNENLINKDDLVYSLENCYNGKNNFQKMTEITRNYGLREKAILLLSGNANKDTMQSTLQWYRNISSSRKIQSSQAFQDEISEFKKSILSAVSIDDLMLIIKNCSDSICDHEEKKDLFDKLTRVAENPYLRKYINENNLNVFKDFSEKSYEYGIVEAVYKIINQSYKKNLNEIQCLDIDSLNKNFRSLQNKKNNINGVNWMLAKHKNPEESININNSDLSSIKIKELYDVIEKNQLMNEDCAKEIYNKLDEIDSLMPGTRSDIKEFIVKLKNGIENDFDGIKNNIKNQSGDNKPNLFKMD